MRHRAGILLVLVFIFGAVSTGGASAASRLVPCAKRSHHRLRIIYRSKCQAGWHALHPRRGATGPTGATGHQGATGPQGPAGAPGAAGSNTAAGVPARVAARARYSGSVQSTSVDNAMNNDPSTWSALPVTDGTWTQPVKALDLLAGMSVTYVPPATCDNSVQAWPSKLVQVELIVDGVDFATAADTMTPGGPAKTFPLLTASALAEPATASSHTIVLRASDWCGNAGHATITGAGLDVVEFQAG